MNQSPYAMEKMAALHQAELLALSARKGDPSAMTTAHPHLTELILPILVLSAVLITRI